MHLKVKNISFSLCYLSIFSYFTFQNPMRPRRKLLIFRWSQNEVLTFKKNFFKVFHRLPNGGDGDSCFVCPIVFFFHIPPSLKHCQPQRSHLKSE
jgi:hypothetical protein